MIAALSPSGMTRDLSANLARLRCLGCGNAPATHGAGKSATGTPVYCARCYRLETDVGMDDGRES
jgi:hypothetical protein